MSVNILHGDCRDVLLTLPNDHFDCICTSPPYWGLRSYLPEGHDDKALEIGLEPTLDAYVETMRAVAQELWRVLRPEGTFWLNLGDGYTSGGRATYRSSASDSKGHQVQDDQRRPPTPAGLKPKDLCMIPHRVALALQADGWWVRQDIVWAKANGMPESARDRPARAHEYVFMLTKSEEYYFGYDDVKLPLVPESIGRLARAMRAQLGGGDAGFVMSGGSYAPPGQTPHASARKSDKQRGHARRHAGFNDRWDAMEKASQQSKGAALRSVWWVAPGCYDGQHFAVMPEEIAAACILGGCPPGGHVLDPFSGAGTTGLVADRLGRDATLIELNPAYLSIGADRISNDAPLFVDVAGGKGKGL